MDRSTDATIRVFAYIFAYSLFLLPLLQAAEQTRVQAASQSKYLSTANHPASGLLPEPDLEGFRTEISPILGASCVVCHGPDKMKAKFRIDTLDPDLANGKDADWWLEVMAVLSNCEMPPPDDDVEMPDADRTTVIDWLAEEAQMASQVKRSESAQSSFRRMTRYEFNYALQDLLGLSRDFTSGLPPETVSEDGFQNSSEMLQMTSLQFSGYRDIAREALKSATIQGPQPEPIYFSMTMEKGGDYYVDWANEHIKFYRLEKEAEENDSDILGRFNKYITESNEKPFSPHRSHFLNRETGEAWNRGIPNGFSLWEPTREKPVDPEFQNYVLAIPHGSNQKIDLGNQLPDRGFAKIRFRASRASAEGQSYPSLALAFGSNPNNNSSHESRISKEDIAITAAPGHPQFYEWVIQMDGLLRNPYLRTGVMGQRPTPTEYINIINTHQGAEYDGATVHIDYIEITAPYFTEWPPASHRNIFPDRAHSASGESQAREVLASFMPKAWRRPISESELDRKVVLFQKLRPSYDSFQQAMIEVLASVLSSPHFLYLTQSEETITDNELASRLSFFLWSSQPDKELLETASAGHLRDPRVLAQQTERLLADSRSKRFVQHFTHQWLGMELLDLLVVDKKAHPDFPKDLKRSMLQEPIEFFQYVLKENRSILDFIHADYAFVDQMLAQYYQIGPVNGNHFQKVRLTPESTRGGLLTQAGLLAMNSDGKDSHPLKRAVWLLENILHDPPPPPPPAVPEIDLTDPAILKMTLKQRMADHRNHAACSSCHSKIDPWGIAFEEFDAVGAWRDEINGQPVDATSLLYNKSKLSGMDGLKRYLLENRQDQIVRAMVHKLASYALGRPIGFADHAAIEQITAKLRKEGDGLRSLILLLVESDLFKNT